MCCIAGAVLDTQLEALGVVMEVAGVALDIGVKIPQDSTSGLNGMACTTINKASNSCMVTAKNYGNIKRRSNGNSDTSSGTNEMGILMLRTVRRTDQPETASITAIKLMNRHPS